LIVSLFDINNETTDKDLRHYAKEDSKESEPIRHPQKLRSLDEKA